MAVHLTTGYPLAAGDEKTQIANLQQVVTSLIDELRHILYHLDDGNFSEKIAKEKAGMKAEIEMSAEAISSVVSKQANLSGAIPVSSAEQFTDTSAVYVLQTKDGAGNVTAEKYYYYNSLSNAWEILSGDSIYTVFNQTAEGFALKGNVLIDGNTVITKNLTLSGNVTWDMDNSPVQTRYSADSASWHSPMIAGDMYMQMSFDGGVTWSDSVKVVGTDGANGMNGSDASVTPENVFNALTDSGAQQGIFAAFVNNDNKIYINAEYLATKIAEVADAVYLGSYDTSTQQKHIYFNNEANIHTYETGVGQNGLAISANGFQIWLKPSEIKFTDPESGSFSAGSITLEDYVTQCGGSATAVFG